MSQRPARVQSPSPPQTHDAPPLEVAKSAVLLDNNPRLDSAALQERLQAVLERHSAAPSVSDHGPSVADRRAPSAQTPWRAKWWNALRGAAMRTGALQVRPIRTVLLWTKSLLLLQRTRAEARRGTSIGEQAAAQLLTLQERVMEVEHCLAQVRQQARALEVEMGGRLAAVERQLTSQGENAIAAIRSLEERLRSASITTDNRLTEAEVALTNLQWLTADVEDSGRVATAKKAIERGGASQQSERQPSADGARGVPARMDDLLLEMSYAFRGTRDEIKARVRRYLPEVIEAAGQGGLRPVLDIGCGRGEWLEVMREGGVTATGVDTSRACVALCVDLGLDVARADAIAKLEGTPDGTLAGVTAHHVVEHMPFNDVVRLLDEAHRCITSGGILLLETPNPESLNVGGRTFFFDPTHRMPIPPDVLSLVTKERGFTEVRIERLHPYPEDYQLSGDAGEAERVLNQLLYGPQDYCIVARRP